MHNKAKAKLLILTAEQFLTMNIKAIFLIIDTTDQYDFGTNETPIFCGTP